jgi:predicted DNA-binding WGR domain protein
MGGQGKTTRREFRFIGGSSKKCWAIELNGKSFTVQFGRIGTVGYTHEKTLSSGDAAKREYHKLILEKTKGGYVEVEASASTAISATRDDGDVTGAMAARRLRSGHNLYLFR